jgi:hypothetical protein
MLDNYHCNAASGLAIATEMEAQIQKLCTSKELGSKTP